MHTVDISLQTYKQPKRWNTATKLAHIKVHTSLSNVNLSDNYRPDGEF